MDLFGVIGRPIVHSQSPRLHNAAFAATGISAVYLRIASQAASDALGLARNMDIRGLNVTAPYKQAAAQLAGERDATVDELGVANTLLWRDGAWVASNTDIAGVRDAFRRRGVALQGAEAFVIGAGGAALAAAVALRRQGATVTVAARAPSRARSTASIAGCAWCSLQDAGKLATRARVIVGAVSTDARVVDPAMLRPGTVVLDARYQSESVLVRDARQRGCVIVDGREWLLCQAAEAFRLFTGQKAPFDAMEAALTRDPSPRGSMISLIGFMGCGKSTVAHALGERLGLPVSDTDSLVEGLAGMPVPGVLRESGEPALRALECAALEALSDGPGVLACGGGLITSPESAAQLLARSRLVVWLWAGPRTCLERIGDTAGRPLLGPCPEQSVPRLLQQRMGAYASACDVVIDTEGRSVPQVVDQVIELWSECS